MKREKLKRLLSLEKERRGVSREKLVFVGMHNVAEYYDGWIPPPPKMRKCKRCEFRRVCKLVEAI